MATTDDPDMRDALADVIAESRDPQSWTTGDVRLCMSSGECVEGTIEGIEDESAILRTLEGIRRLAIAETEELQTQRKSRGPE